MKILGEIDNISTLKSGMKVVVKLGEEETKEAMKHIYKFMDKPLEIDININADRQMKRLSQITEGQRNKIFAIIKDIANWVGEDKEHMRNQLQASFIELFQLGDLSLKNCDKEVAEHFIDYLIDIAFSLDIEFKEDPKRGLEDIDKYLYLCCKHKKCCICGKPGEIHHVEAIGMGRDRRKVDDSDNLKMALCREHHTEAHKLGQDSFNNKYHVRGVQYDK